jgi:glycerophosphoryl diester phosphodiesterase
MVVGGIVMLTKSHKTKIWAHRGASGWDKQYAPENTIPAFERAVKMGADGIETDV